MARASATLAALFLLIYAVHFSTSASMKKDLSRATTNKTLELVDALKQDLRKNNDDYKDIRVVAKLGNPYLGGAVASDPEELGNPEAQGNALGPARRRMDRPSSARTAAAPWGIGASGGATKAAPASVSVPAKMSAAARRNKDDNSKLHQLLAQEGLLHKFLRGLPEAGKKKYVDWMKDPPRGEGGGEMRPRAVFDSKEYFRPTPDTIPEADLDMLAATGEHIATLKRRGRLCHRHILFPEGPKYDSRGKVYLNAHELAVNFQATRRPKLLLPRCCNCCQKSVLGCE